MAKSALCATGWVLGIACCIGCGGDERPPLLPDEETAVGSLPDAGVTPRLGAGGSGSSSNSEFTSSPCGSMVPFDPAQVYLRGPLQAGATSGFGIAPLWDPNLALLGFGTFMSEEVIRPSDGSLLFDDPDGIYVFSADECVVTTPPATYVTKPLDNDEKLSGPDGCSANGFRLAPNGSFLFRCKDASWMTESGQTMAESNGLPLSFDGQRVLTGTGVFDIAEQALYPFNGFPLTNVILGQRVQAGGFWIVTSVGDGTTKSQLWLVDATGNLQLVGNYPDPPADPGFSAVWTSLAGDGTLVQLGKPAQGSARPNLIVRRTLSGEFAVAYDESTNPLIRASYPSLVTGP